MPWLHCNKIPQLAYTFSPLHSYCLSLLNIFFQIQTFICCYKRDNLSLLRKISEVWSLCFGVWAEFPHSVTRALVRSCTVARQGALTCSQHSSLYQWCKRVLRTGLCAQQFTPHQPWQTCLYRTQFMHRSFIRLERFCMLQHKIMFYAYYVLFCTSICVTTVWRMKEYVVGRCLSKCHVYLYTTCAGIKLYLNRLKFK